VDTSSSLSDAKPSGKKRPSAVLGIKHLPEELRASFSKVFCPRYIEYIGLSSEPWISPGLKVTQRLFNETYPDYEVKLAAKDVACDVVSFIYLYYYLETAY
jgi:hypothetical protein